MDPDHNERWDALRHSKPRDLTGDEWARVIPPREPAGSPMNRLRAARMKILRNRGFTLNGKRI